MERVIRQLNYAFLCVIMAAAFFVLKPSDSDEVKLFQANLKSDFAQSFASLIGDESFLEPFAFIWNTSEAFYQDTSNQALALLKPTDTMVEFTLRFNKQYQSDKIAAHSDISLSGYMALDPLINIVPVSDAEKLLDPYFSEEGFESEGRVAGESIGAGFEDKNPVWLTIPDSLNGEVYCLAIFDGVVNSYQGPCVFDEESTIQTN